MDAWGDHFLWFFARRRSIDDPKTYKFIVLFLSLIVLQTSVLPFLEFSLRLFVV